jgi:basic membrane protein A
MKELDVMVYDLIRDYYNFDFKGGTSIHGNLSNGGVGMAPFHNYGAMIPDSIKSALIDVEAGIKNGTIKTGWPE